MLAAKAYLLPPGDGGLTSRVYGLPFFEEVPLTNGLSPHVLNGHLYSLYMLSKLQEYRRDAAIVNLTDAAAELTRRILLAYDMGYWTRYDLAPRFVDVPLAFEPASHMQWPRRLKTLDVILPNGNSRLIKARPGHQDGRDVMYGPGWEGRGAEARIAKPGAFLQVMMPNEVWAEDALEKFARVKASFHGHGDVPNLAILGFREGVREYVNLPVLSATQSANETEVVYGIGIHDLQWSSLQVYYVSWHTRLLTELWREFGGDLFYVTALRWREYLEAQEASQADTLEGVEEAIVASLSEGEISNVKSFVNEQLSVEVPQVTSRVFHPLHNPANDNEIAERLDRRDPDDLLAWDIVRKISSDCSASIDATAARLRRLGFYTDVIDIVSSKQGNILATLLDVTVAGDQGAIMPRAGIWFQAAEGEVASVAELIAFWGGKPQKIPAVAGSVDLKDRSIAPRMLSKARKAECSTAPFWEKESAEEISIQRRPIPYIEEGRELQLLRADSDGARVIDKSAFYTGHGPENSLDGDPNNNYTAAREDALPNAFTFELEQALVPTKLNIVWNMPDQYATEFTLSGISPDGRMVRLLKVSENLPYDQGVNEYTLETQESFSRFHMEVSATAGQNRLLMRQMRVSGFIPQVGDGNKSNANAQ